MINMGQRATARGNIEPAAITKDGAYAPTAWPFTILHILFLGCLKSVVRFERQF